MRQQHPLTTGNKVGIYFVYAALVIMGAGILTILSWAFQPANVLEVNNAPVPVRTIREHPTADGVIILKIDYCKLIEATGRVRVSFVSASREAFLPVSEDRALPECAVRELPILIPHEIPGGSYIVRFRIEYKINPLKNVVEEFDSLPFEIADSSN